VALLWVGLAVLAQAATPSPPRLRIEYVQSILREDQPLAVCTRVEAARAEGARIAVAVRDGDGQVLAAAGASGTPKPGAPWRCECSLRLAGGTPEALDVVLTRASGAPELAKETLRVLDGRKPLPPLRAQGMRLVDEQGRPVVIRIEHRVHKPDERWPLVRWVSHKLYGDKLAFNSVLLLGEDLGAPEDGYLSQFRAAKAKFAARALPVPSRVEPPTPPILRAVAALSAAEEDPPPDLAVLSLGHRDPDFGTDLLLFERGLELIVQQLERRGCGHLVLVSPLGPSHLEKRLEPYAAAAKRVARTYRGRYLDLRRSLDDDCWRSGAGADRLLLRFPNAKGHKALAEALTRAIVRLRR